MKKRVLKISEGSTTRWCHSSKKGSTVMLRFFGPDYTEPEKLNLDNPDDKTRYEKLLEQSQIFSVHEIAALTEDVLPFSANKLKVDSEDGVVSWAKVFERLNELSDVIPTGKNGHSSRRQSCRLTASGNDISLIPQTRLRRFYETLRLFSKRSLAEAMADHLVGASGKRTKKLEVIIEESIRHFSRYSNIDERFQERSNPDWFEKYTCSPSAFAKCLVARMRPKDGPSHILRVEGADIGVQAVDYEISPFRTTGNARFENGMESTSGGGGIDLLLKDCATGGPIVGEIKAETDRDLFLAIIQALNYTLELSTEPQIERLRRAYPEFGSLGTDARFDIFLICEAGKEHGLVSQTKSLIKCLLGNPEGPVAGIVQRVRIIEASFHGQSGVSLNQTYSFPE